MGSLSVDDSNFVATVSNRWVEDLAEQLQSVGRFPEGGWPCTLSDARRRLTNQLATMTAPVPTADFNSLVREVYASAKSLWLAKVKTPGIPVDLLT